MGASTEIKVPVEAPPSKEAGNIEMLESASASSQEVEFDQKATKKLISKIDWALLPFLSLLYLLSFLDRTNIGNARLAGLEKDLGMSGLDYNVSTPNYLASSRSITTYSPRGRPCNLFPVLRWGRDSFQHDDEENSSFHLDSHYYGSLGSMLHAYGLSPQFWWSSCCSFRPWYCRRWPVSRYDNKLIIQTNF